MSDADAEAARNRPRHGSGWMPGVDVEHPEFGPGWVWGSGLGRVTVRFETAETGPGPGADVGGRRSAISYAGVITTDDDEDEIGRQPNPIPRTCLRARRQRLRTDDRR